MKNLMPKSFVLVPLAALITGCASTAPFDDQSALRKELANTAVARDTAPAVLAEDNRVLETPGAFIPLQKRKYEETTWLKDIRVQLQMGTVHSQRVTLSEVLRMLAKQGVNVTSELPLDRYYYTGYSLNDLDAESALKMILTSAGLDYQVDSVRKLVVVKPMGSRTWYLNIGNRKSTYASGTSGEAQSTSSGSGTSSTVNSALNTEKSRAESTGASTINSADDFWGSLKAELEARLKVMMLEPQVSQNTAAPVVTAPVASAGLSLPPMIPPPPMGADGKASVAKPTLTMPTATAPALAVAQPASSEGLNYVSKTVGTYAINPETGAITVQAPHWVLDEMDTYLKRVQSMYNTDLVFQGELIMLSTESSKSEGLDISSFARFANQRYGVVFKNNGLGGVTLSFPQGSLLPTVATGPMALAGPALGITSALDGLQIFNAYLTNLGRVSSLQKPVLTTTSGVPADFRRTVTRFFNTVSQQAASGGTGGAAVGTQNTLISQDFGTILRVNPRVDVATGLIRAQIELVQTTQAGTQNVTQALTSGDSVQQVETQLPIVSKIIYSGEALLRDGDLVVMGGQTEDTENNTRDGITGLMDAPAVGSVFGKAAKQKTRNIFYFALKVTANKR